MVADKNVTDPKGQRNPKNTNQTASLSEKHKRFTKKFFQEQVAYAADNFKSSHLSDIFAINTKIKFDDRYFRTYKNNTSEFIYLKSIEDDPTVVRFSSLDELQCSIMDYVRQIRLEFPSKLMYGNWTSLDCQETSRRWKLMTRAVKYPALFKWPDNNQLAFHQFDFSPSKTDWNELLPDVDFNPYEHGEARTLEFIGSGFRFMEILSRVNNWVGLCAFVGSCFDLNSHHQQALVLMGEGGEGKSAFIRFLSSMFGPAMTNGASLDLKDKFGLVDFIDKRVVAFADVNDMSIFQSPTFKGLIGGDKVRIEFKRGAKFFANLNVKVIISTNYTPEISSMKCDTRRIIPIRFEPIDGKEIEQSKYDALLYKERAEFVSFCQWVYANTAQKGEPIPVDDTIQEIAEDNEQHLQWLFDELFVYDTSLKPHECARPNDFCEALSTANINKTADIKKFKSFITVRFGIKKIRSKNADRFWYYRGLKIRKSPHEVSVSNPRYED